MRGWIERPQLHQHRRLIPIRVPVTGAEQTARLIDPELPSNTLIQK